MTEEKKDMKKEEIKTEEYKIIEDKEPKAKVVRVSRKSDIPPGVPDAIRKMIEKCIDARDQAESKSGKKLRLDLEEGKVKEVAKIDIHAELPVDSNDRPFTYNKGKRCIGICVNGRGMLITQKQAKSLLRELKDCLEGCGGEERWQN